MMYNIRLIKIFLVCAISIIYNKLSDMWHNSVKISVNMLLICGIYCVIYVQVPLGILKKCETNHDDMILILDHLHKYVPITSTTEMVMDPHIGSQIPVEKDLFHHILFGGDMLTTKMARIALHIRENSNSVWRV